MKILWMSDSPTSPSGFGNVTRFVCAALADRGHQVSILGWQAHGMPTLWHNCTIYPVRHNSFGADVLLNYLRRLQPDLLITLADVWWLTFISDPAIANFRRTARIPWALYYPIDGDMGDGRLPPSWVHVLETVDLPIAMSLYGRHVTQVNGVTPAYIPHGVDTTIFRPPADKAAAKRALGYARWFVILSDARNQPRKLWPRTLEIFRRFAANKDDVVLHMHCDPHDPAAMSPEYHYDIQADVEFLGLRDKVRFTAGMTIDNGVPLAELAAIYQASDVHLLSSWGEGFGLPTLQAAAAGVVPLASDYTASRELVTAHGEAIKLRCYIPDQFGLRRALIDIDDAVNRLERLYRDRNLLALRSQASHRFAHAYDWARVVPQWDALLQQQVPRLRENISHRVTASRVSLDRDDTSQPNDLSSKVHRAIPGLPDHASITVSVVESKAGQLMAEVMRDASEYHSTLTLPVRLPSNDLSLTKERVSGCVYAASEHDVPIVRALGRIFPGLNVWSSVTLDLGVGLVSGEPVRAKAVPPGSATFRRHLAASTLALDLGGADPQLPVEAARLGVPCIGLARQANQARLWPRLSMETPDPAAAAELGRWILTDQGDYAAICANAHQRLASFLTEAAASEHGQPRSTTRHVVVR